MTTSYLSSDTVRLTSIDEVVAAIPYHLGFGPHRSIVVHALRGRQLVGTARVDLPPTDLMDDVADSVMTALIRGGRPDAIMVIGFEDQSGEALACLLRCAEVAQRRRLRVHSAALVCDGQLAEVDLRAAGSSGRLLATPGRPRAVLESSRVPAVADLVGRGRAPLPSRADLAARLEPLPESTQVIGHLGTFSGSPDRDLRLWGRYLRAAGSSAAAQPSPAIVARLVGSLSDRMLRDGLLAWFCPGLLPLDGLDPAYTSRIRTHLPPPSAHAEDAAVRGHRREQRELLIALVQRTPTSWPAGVADICTVLAQQAWFDGDGAMASIAVERALDHAPEHTLARLLGQLIGAGIRSGELADAITVERSAQTLAHDPDSPAGD